MTVPMPRPRAGASAVHSPTNGAAKLLTAGEVGQRWQLPVSTIYRLTREGAIPVVRIGKHYRYRTADLEAFEAAGGVSADG